LKSGRTVSAAPAAGAADEPWLDIRQPQIVWPAMNIHRQTVTAMIIGATPISRISPKVIFWIALPALKILTHGSPAWRLPAISAPSSAAERYQREHGHKPQVKRFWRFILVSQNVTAKDHTLSLDQPMIYHMALEKAQEAAGLRKSIRIIVRAGKQFRWCRRASCRAALH
jgi:hypothetical protein